jgi:hypothetical protein
MQELPDSSLQPVQSLPQNWQPSFFRKRRPMWGLQEKLQVIYTNHYLITNIIKKQVLVGMGEKMVRERIFV